MWKLERHDDLHVGSIEHAFGDDMYPLSDVVLFCHESQRHEDMTK